MRLSLFSVVCLLALALGSSAHLAQRQGAQKGILSARASRNTSRPAQARTLRRYTIKKVVSPGTKESLHRFKLKYGEQTKVLWNNQTGLPGSIYGFSAKTVKGKRELDSRQFLTENQALLLRDEPIDSLKWLRTRQSRNSSHVDFQQTYQGIPVHRGIVSVHFRGDAISMVNGSYLPGIEVATSPEHSAEEAIATARKDSGVGGQASRPELVIQVKNGVASLCWRLTAWSLSPLFDWQYLINTETNEVVEKVNRIRHVDGTGLVYPDNQTVTPQPTVVTLRNLDGGGFLRGSFARVESFQGALPFRVFGFPEAFDAGLAFNFPPSDRRFAEQNVYYHINQMHDFFKSRFDFSQLDRPIRAFVHHSNPDAAFFAPSCDCLGFGDGSGFPNGSNNISHDGEAVSHEYTHAVIDKIVPLFDGLAQAMEEAFADYFPCSVFNDPSFAEGAWPQEGGLRNLVNSSKFPDDVIETSPHQTSLIWGAVLWDLRAAVGAAVADEIVFSSLSYLPQNGLVDFKSGLVALIEADSALFGGGHVSAIRQIFNARGIIEPDVDAEPIPSGDDIHWTLPPPSSGFDCAIFTELARIEVLPGTTSLGIRVGGSDDVDLYVRYNKGVDLVGNQIVADHQAVTNSFFESLTIDDNTSPPLRVGTYYIAVAHCSNTAVDISLTATTSKDVMLTSGTEVSGQIKGFLGAAQYTIEVPVNAAGLEVRLIGDDPAKDLDLVLRKDDRVVVNQGTLFGDAFSETLTHLESLVLDGSTFPTIAPGSKYFIGVLNYSSVTSNYRLIATTYSGPSAPAETFVPAGTTQTNSMPGSSSGELVGFTNHLILVPRGASQLEVNLQNLSASNINLYVREGSRVFVNGGLVVSDFGSNQAADSQTLTVGLASSPPLDSNLYYLAVGNLSPNTINYTITATITQGGGPELSHGVTAGTVVSNSVGVRQAGKWVLDGDQFFIDVPVSASGLWVDFQGDPGSLIGLLGGCGQRIDPSLLIFGFDYASDTAGERGTLAVTPSSFPPLAAGRYYFGVVNLVGSKNSKALSAGRLWPGDLFRDYLSYLGR